MKGAEPIYIDKKSKIGILMVHGFSGSPDQFREISIYFAEKGFTVFAPLLKGHGTSPDDMFETSAYDWAQSVKDAYFKLREKTEKIFLIGNSFGASLCMWLAKELNNEPIGVASMGGAVFLRHHFVISLRIHTYGFLKKFYKKPIRYYKMDYTDMNNEVSYSSLPTRSIRQFLRFLKKEIQPSFENVKIPALVVHSENDRVVHPKSAAFIYDKLNSPLKKLYWVKSNHHIPISDECKSELFERIFQFLQEIIEKNNNK